MKNKYKKQYIVVSYQNKAKRVLAYACQKEFKTKENLIRGILEDYLTSDLIDMREMLNIIMAEDASTPYRIINSNFTVKGGRAINGKNSPMRVSPKFMLEVDAAIKMELRLLSAECNTSMARIVNVIINDYCKNIQVPDSFEASKPTATTKVSVCIPQKEMRQLKFSASRNGRTLAQEVAFKLSEFVESFKADKEEVKKQVKELPLAKKVKKEARYIDMPVFLNTAIKNIMTTFTCSKSDILRSAFLA